MGVESASVRGVITTEGALVLQEPLALPPGEVQVTVHPVQPPPQQPKRFWAMMESIWADLRAAGHVPRSREEIDAELNALRDEVEEDLLEIEELHRTCEGSSIELDAPRKPPAP